ncbi:hypothetical protein GCM10027347_61200 [Larkinella harenae]
MSITDKAPDSDQDGGFPKELYDDETGQGKMPVRLADYLTDFDALQSFREILREWYTTSAVEGYKRHDNLDATLFNGLDDLFADLQKPALMAQLINSHNIQNDPKQ